MRQPASSPASTSGRGAQQDTSRMGASPRAGAAAEQDPPQEKPAGMPDSSAEIVSAQCAAQGRRPGRRLENSMCA